MKKVLRYSFWLVACEIFLVACNPASPEKTFDIAVLNSNMLVGFANEGLSRELESPSAKMDENGKVVPMQRVEVIAAKIKFTEDNLKKLKSLKENGDTKDILESSLALHEYVLAVYKEEYMQLAELYDNSAPTEQIKANAHAIQNRHFHRFDELYNILISNGKRYAAKHSIKVNWAM